MMKKYVMITIVSALMLILSIPLSSGESHARKISDPAKVIGMEYNYYQGMIVSKSPSGDYVTTYEKNIFLIDAGNNRYKYETTIHAQNGDRITFNDLKPGDWIYVYGGGLRDSGMAAKDIYVLKGKLSQKELKRFLDEKSLKPW